MSVLTYLSIGSNVGDRWKNISTGLEKVQQCSVGRRIKVSEIYESEPWGEQNQATFLNCCVRIETLLDPETLLSTLQAIELESGRSIERSRWSPRELDIDILLYGSVQMSTDKLTIPHQELSNRRFVL